MVKSFGQFIILAARTGSHKARATNSAKFKISTFFFVY